MKPNSPAKDELEICVFSRAGGEAIAIHVGQHKWILIDCLLSENGQPIALEYLNAIGVDATAVEAVLLTHWHDDHIKGAADLISACVNARVAMPIVLKKGEFAGLIAATRPAKPEDDDFDTGVTELTAVLRILLDGRKNQHAWVLANSRFMMKTSPLYEFEALSPSNSDVSDFLASLPKDMDSISKGGRIPCPDRNEASVAAVVTVGPDQMLFGADLEVSHATGGWQAVDAHAWMGRGKGSFFKIPHHGSKNADHPPVWQNLLQANVFAALTPYNRNKGLPQASDLKRIVAYTSNAYAASTARSRSAAKKDSETNGILRDDGVELVKVPTDLGYVRFRKPIGVVAPWTVHCFGVGSYRIAA